MYSTLILDVPESESVSLLRRIELFAGEAKDVLNPRREKEREAEKKSGFGRLRAEKNEFDDQREKGTQLKRDPSESLDDRDDKGK